MRRVLAAVVAVLTLLAAAGCGSDPRVTSAADQVPSLAVALDRVDAALGSQRFAVARQQLRAMKSAVVKAREAGDLREVDARRVLDAIARLMATLPAGTTRPPNSSDPAPAPTTEPLMPSESASKRPEKTTGPESKPPRPSDTTAPSTKPSRPPSTRPPPPSSSPTSSATTGAASAQPTAAASPTS